MPIYNLCMCMMHAASARLSTPAGQNIIVPVYRTTPAVKSGVRVRFPDHGLSPMSVLNLARRMLYGKRTKKLNRTTQQQYNRRLSVLIQKLGAGWAAPAAESRQKSAAEARSRSHSIGPNSILKPKQKRQTTFSRGHITAYGKRP